ncbi:hypothetical protein HZ326_22388 [Fusarium oxysporum f. sp. albedinis]|nr:hypothetical protein HZ326_22388 [Fusarium oxysporum f. sp. albedinis]
MPYRTTGLNYRVPWMLLMSRVHLLLPTQTLPHTYLGEHSKHLYAFQRTPSSIDVRLDQLTDPEWSKSLKKGSQQDRMHNFNNLVAGA